MTNDDDRETLTWSVRYVERGQRDHLGAVIPKGWWVVGFEEQVDTSIAAIHVADHAAGTHAAASLAAVTAHLLNGYELERQTIKAEA